MSSVSLCMIVKDEEDTIGRCLESVHDLVDEINNVVTGSTDREDALASYTSDPRIMRRISGPAHARRSRGLYKSVIAAKQTRLISPFRSII